MTAALVALAVLEAAVVDLARIEPSLVISTRCLPDAATQELVTAPAVVVEELGHDHMGRMQALGLVRWLTAYDRQPRLTSRRTRGWTTLFNAEDLEWIERPRPPRNRFALLRLTINDQRTTNDPDDDLRTTLNF